MRHLLIVFALLPLGTALWPSSAFALECDPAIPGGTCYGSGQKFHLSGRSAFCAPVSPMRLLVNEPIGRDGDAAAQSVLRERTPDLSIARHAMPGGVVLARGDDTVSAAPPAMESAAQPGRAALLVAGLLGMGAVARRRIASIPG